MRYHEFLTDNVNTPRTLVDWINAGCPSNNSRFKHNGNIYLGFKTKMGIEYRAFNKWGLIRIHLSLIHEGQYSIVPLTSRDSPFIKSVYDSPEEAYADIRKVNISNALRKKNEIYNRIPKYWNSESRKIAKKIINAGYLISEFKSSMRSNSNYIILGSGLTIRLSDHDLPSHYQFFHSPDIYFYYGENIDLLMNEIAEKEKDEESDD